MDVLFRFMTDFRVDKRCELDLPFLRGAPRIGLQIKLLFLRNCCLSIGAGVSSMGVSGLSGASRVGPMRGSLLEAMIGWPTQMLRTMIRQ